jgi:5-methylcytosine-specific restriction enzyme subunit McrC
LTVLGALTSRAAAEDPSVVCAPRIGRIPVRNLWFLFLYASDLSRFSGRFDAALAQDDADLATLAARILADAVEQRLRRNLSRGYAPREAVLTRVRGRIDHLKTEAGHLLERGRVACRFGAFTVDTPRNQLIRAALTQIAWRVADRPLSHRCLGLAADLGRAGVSAQRPSAQALAGDVIGRNEIQDRLVVATARLALDLALPTEDAGPVALAAAERDAVAARKLFERAAAGLYEIELDRSAGWRVGRNRLLGWDIEAATPGVRAILPSMRADIMLENAALGRRVVIDTKFTNILTPGWYREQSLKSGYLYQLYAYLRSQTGRDALADRAEGILLHPSAGVHVDEAVVIQGHRMRFATVDLAASPAAIRARFLDVVLSPIPDCAQEKSPTQAPG